jgi:hypothetical protein
MPVTGQFFFTSGDKDLLPVIYPSTTIASFTSQREKIECVHDSLRLRDFQTPEPTSSLAYEKIPEKKEP